MGRIEELERTKAEAAEDIKDLYVEVKAAGLDVAAVKNLIKIRLMDEDKHMKQVELAATVKSYADQSGDSGAVQGLLL